MTKRPTELQMLTIKLRLVASCWHHRMQPLVSERFESARRPAKVRQNDPTDECAELSSPWQTIYFNRG